MIHAIAPNEGTPDLIYFLSRLESFDHARAGATAFPVGFGKFARTEADMIDLRTRELNNGRAAQMGILGMMVHEQLDGKPFIFFDKFEIYAPFGN